MMFGGNKVKEKADRSEGSFTWIRKSPGVWMGGCWKEGQRAHPRYWQGIGMHDHRKEEHHGIRGWDFQKEGR